MYVSMKIYFEQSIFNFSITYAKYKTEIKEIILMKIHKPIPCINGFTPTDFNFLIDKLLPIKNSVMVNPFFAKITKIE